MSSPDLLPLPGTVVRLQVGPVGDVVAQAVCAVLSSSPDEVVLDVPRTVGAPRSAAAGTPVSLGWATLRGLYALDAVVAAPAAARTPWRLRPRGAVELLQRRRFSRAAMCTPVAVVPVGDGQSAPVGGWLVDLGEGGARTLLELAQRLEPGSRVEVHLSLEGVPVSVTGRVRRTGGIQRSLLTHIGPSQSGASRLEEVVLGFDEPVDHAQQIRRAVLREQVRARRSARATP